MIFDKLASLSMLILGFDIFCLNKKFLVLNMVERNLKIKYRRTFLGFFWTILTPIVMSTTYYFVFKVILNVQKEHYLAFMICGMMPWNFFVQTLGESTESIVTNAGLLTKIPIPIHVFPYVATITNFSTLVFAIPVVFAAAILSGSPINIHSLWIFYFCFILMLVTYSLGAILSMLYVYLRDLRHAIGLIIQLWFYATPVLYDSSMVPEKYRWILYANPIGCIFEGIHITFISGQRPAKPFARGERRLGDAPVCNSQNSLFETETGFGGEDMKTPAISVQNLTKEFNFFSERPETLKSILVNALKGKFDMGEKTSFRVLDDVSFDILPGEFVGIMGKNGAGKSTLLKLISGIYTPTSGRIVTHGTIAPLIELGAGFHPDLTGYENIFLNASILGFGKKATQAALSSIVEFSELGDHLQRPIRNYSSGMMVRLGFSIATHLDSPTLLVDEVLAVGDQSFQRKCIQKIESLHQEGRTIALITHDPSSVRKHCTRCIVIDKSKKIFDGSAEDGVNVYEQKNE